MTTKACTNIKCPAYAHFVYTVAMRCVLCRWDLRSAQRISDAGGILTERGTAKQHRPGSPAEYMLTDERNGGEGGI
jgi:hypothetical protein